MLREVATAVCTQPDEMRQRIVAEIRSVGTIRLGSGADE